MQDKDFLSYFDNLGRGPSSKQVAENSEKILTTLLTVEHQDPNKVKDFNSQLGPLVSEDLEYAIGRLLHGATTEELPNKLSFGTPLLAVLKTFKHIQPEKFISYTDKELDRSNAFSKGERSQLLASRLLSIFCLIESGKIDQLPNSLNVYTNLFTSFVKNMKEFTWAGQLVLYLIEKSIENSADAKVGQKKLNAVSKIFKTQFNSMASNFNIDVFGVLLFLARKQIEFGGDKENFLHDAVKNILDDTKQLAKLFQATLEIYPEKSITLRYLAEYLTRTMTVKQQEKFWGSVSNLLKDTSFFDIDKKPKYQLYFGVLTLLKYWIKDPKLSGKAFVKILNTQVFELWVKQMRVMNKSLNKVSKRIELYLSKRIAELLNESGELSCLDFLLKIKTA